MFFKSTLLSALYLMTNASFITADHLNQHKAPSTISIKINDQMTPISNKEICLLYLKKYAEKDLNSIDKMFSNDIVLRDWKIRVEGKEKALNETRKNFNNADTIAIEVLATYESKNTVAAELKITVDATEVLYVVDVITINADHKISSIRAYLGRGDEHN